MRIALVTCRELPPSEVDDQFLLDAFADLGVEIAQPAWDDPAVDWSTFDAALIRTAWDYHFHRDAFVAWARRVSCPLFNAADTVEWNTHKSYLRDLEGVPVVPTVWLSKDDDIARIVAEKGWNEAFLKPAVGATAEGTLRFDMEGLDRAQSHARTLLTSGDVLLQPFLPVDTHGERSAIVVDGRVTHCVRKDPVPGDYRVQDDFGGTDVRYDPTEPELALVAAALRVTGPLLYARVDWLIDSTGVPRLVELELVEPSLFFRHCPTAARRLADALLERLPRR